MKAKEAIAFIEKKHLKKEVPDFKVGDLVKVYQKVLEGEKTRTQIYEGIVIRRKGSGTRTSFTVLRQLRGDMIDPRILKNQLGAKRLGTYWEGSK